MLLEQTVCLKNLSMCKFYKFIDNILPLESNNNNYFDLHFS